MQKQIRERIGKPFKVSYKELEDLQPKSLKKTSRKRIEKLKNSLMANGFASPFFVWQSRNKNYTVDGHHRCIALSELESEGVQVPKLTAMPVDAKNRAEAKHLLLVLSSQYADITKDGLEGFTDGMDIGGLIEQVDLGFDLTTSPNIVEDEIPQIPANPNSKMGDLYELGDHRVLCGDSRTEIGALMAGNNADMVFTDPPFDMTDLSWFDPSHSMGAYLIMQSDKNAAKLAMTATFHYFIVHYYSFGFVRSNNMPQNAHHLIAVLGNPKFHNRMDGFKTVICEQMERGKLMPYQKRVGIPSECISHYSEPMAIVGDWFPGSGSTLIACEQTNRKCYGIEIDPHYVDIIIQRWVNLTGQTKIKKNGKPYTWNQD